MAPARPYWKGYLKLSLVSCPIALYSGTSSTERVSFRQINKKTGNRLRQQLIDLLRRRNGRALHGVLLGHVQSDREQVGLRGTDGVPIRDPQHAQEDLLRQVRDIRRVAHADREETPQLHTLSVGERSGQVERLIGHGRSTAETCTF